MKLKFAFILSLLLLLLVVSCSKDPRVTDMSDMEVLNNYLNIPKEPYNYSAQVVPEFFNNQFVKIQDNTPVGNAVTDWGATLGRVLFYDKNLSINNAISCASCHIQAHGFTDTIQFSKGFMGGKTKRHSMSLINARYYISGRFFWDERAATLEDQVLMPIQDAVEMGMNLDTLVRKLNRLPYYPILFKYAFGSSNISSDKISKALAQFVRSIVSYQSKYDVGRAQVNAKEDDFPNLTVDENLGKSIFMTNTDINCSGCHTTDVFIMDNPRNNGLTIDNSDKGIYVHTLKAEDEGKFKAPSLKNVALRKRFMHDGSFSSLRDVVEHYNTQLLSNPNLDSHLKDLSGNPRRMNLLPKEVDALVAFLETLTDHQIVTDPKFSSPFN